MTQEMNEHFLIQAYSHILHYQTNYSTNTVAKKKSTASVKYHNEITTQNVTKMTRCTNLMPQIMIYYHK